MKKIIAYILVIAVIIGIMPAVSFAQSYSDVTENSPYYKDIQMLTAFGVFQGNDGMFYPDKTISRCDFSLILTRLLGVEDAYAKNVFSDVASDHYASNAINTLFNIGIINGVGNGLFMPDGDVTYEQAVKLLVNITGYEQKALSAGGYPHGYTIVASTLGITDGVANDGTLTRADVARMLKNTLKTDIFQKVTFGRDEVGYSAIKGDTILNCYMKIMTVKNVLISSNEQTTIGKEQAGEKKIIADGVTYLVGDSGAEDYIGRRVTLYYRNDNDIKTIVYVEDKGGLSLKIKADNIISFQNNILTYDEHGKIKNLKLSSSAEIIYNGKSTLYSEDLFEIENGSITFFGENSEYNLAVIEEYQNIFIGYINEDERTIYDKYADITKVDGSEIKITPSISYGDETSHLAVFEIADFDDELEFDDLNEGLLVSVYQSKDKYFTKTVINQSVLNGCVEEIGVEHLIINGNEYIYDNKASRMPQLKPGDEATFYFDAEGKIGAWEINGNQKQYGLLIAGMENSNGLSSDVSLKILEQSGKINVFEINDKVQLNDKGYNISNKDEKEAFVKLLSYSPKSQTYSDSILRQVIKYKKNSDNKITSLYTHEYKSANDEAFSLDYDQTILQYRTGIRSFEMKFYVSPETVIFRSPFAIEADDDGKLYRVMGLGSLRGSASYTVEAYDMSDTGCAGAVVLFSGSSGGEPADNASWLVVEDVREALGEDGETTKMIYGMSGGKYVKYLATSSDAVSLAGATGDPGRFPKCGDVLRVSLDDDNQITEVGLEFNIDNLYESFSGNDARPFIYSNWLRYATVYSREGNYLYVAKGVTKNVSEEFFASADMFVMAVSGNVYIYDSEEQRIKKGSANDIYTYKTNGEKASKIFARFNYDTTTDILIIR